MHEAWGLVCISRFFQPFFLPNESPSFWKNLIFEFGTFVNYIFGNFRTLWEWQKTINLSKKNLTTNLAYMYFIFLRTLNSILFWEKSDKTLWFMTHLRHYCFEPRMHEICELSIIMGWTYCSKNMEWTVELCAEWKKLTTFRFYDIY